MNKKSVGVIITAFCASIGTAQQPSVAPNDSNRSFLYYKKYIDSVNMAKISYNDSIRAAMTNKQRNDIFFQEKFAQLRMDIARGVASAFFLNECLDLNSMSYCYVSDHKTRSLRHDLIKALNLLEVDKLYKLIIVHKSVTKLCRHKHINILYSDISTLNLIILARKTDH